MFLRCLTLAAVMTMTAAEADAVPESPAADVQLSTELDRISVQVDQGAPFAPGGCRADYRWHTTYGGCRRQEAVTQIEPCPPGHMGTRTRQRTAYILQADANNVAHGPWEPWRDTCQRPRLQGVVDTLVAKVRGNGPAPRPVGSRLSKKLAKQMVVGGYHSLFAVTIDRTAAKLRCVYSRSTSSGSSGSGTSYSWKGVLAPLGRSVDADWVGECRLSDNGATANLRGNCDSTSGGDSDYCQWRALTVRIIDTSPCMVTTRVERKGGSGRRGIQAHYSLCD